MTELFQWAKLKLEIAKRLHDGECNAGYPEFVIICCSIISGMAATLWEGSGIDKKRFIELIIRYANKDIKSKYISISSLYYDLKRKQYFDLKRFADEFYKYDETRILTDIDADYLESEIISLFPTLNKKYLRNYSYPSMLYKHLRCGYIHEYDIDTKTSPFALTRKDAYISYVNIRNFDFRKVHFHFKWLCDLIISIEENIRNAHSDNDFPLKRNANWWIDGTNN